MESKYFVGKICTVITRPINRNFKEEDPENYREQIYQYFLGKVLAVNSQGILLEQILTPERLRSYFFHPNIVGLFEEQSLEADSPENEALLKTIRENYESQRNEEVALKEAVDASPTKDGPVVLGEITTEGDFINTDAMLSLAEQMKEKFDK